MLDPQLLFAILTRTRDLIAQGYCKVWYAVDSNDQPTGVSSPDACRWCPEGAFFRACSEHQATLTYARLLRNLEKFIPAPNGGMCLSTWSDLPTTTQADVLALLSRAIVGAKP